MILDIYWIIIQHQNRWYFSLGRAADVWELYYRVALIIVSDL